MIFQCKNWLLKIGYIYYIITCQQRLHSNTVHHFSIIVNEKHCNKCNKNKNKPKKGWNRRKWYFYFVFEIFSQLTIFVFHVGSGLKLTASSSLCDEILFSVVSSALMMACSEYLWFIGKLIFTLFMICFIIRCFVWLLN